MAVVAVAAVPKSGRVVVIAAPGTPPGDLLAIITRSGGSLVTATAHPWIAVADGDAGGFTRRLFSNGAILVLDGGAAFLCTGGTLDS